MSKEKAPISTGWTILAGALFITILVLGYFKITNISSKNIQVVHTEESIFKSLSDGKSTVDDVLKDKAKLEAVKIGLEKRILQSAYLEYDKFTSHDVKSMEAFAKTFMTAAQKGNGKAEFYLGQMYRRGDYFPKSMEKAVFWYKFSSEHGNKNGQFNYATCFREGIGVDKNLKNAFKWYLKAANQKFADAEYMVAFMYVNDEILPRDDAQMMYWYRQAAKHGNAKAISVIKSYTANNRK